MENTKTFVTDEVWFILSKNVNNQNNRHQGYENPHLVREVILNDRV
jgi:hypothetical protein